LSDRLIREFPLGPVGDGTPEILGRLAGENHDLTVGFGTNGGGRSGTGSIREALCRGHFGGRDFLHLQPPTSPMSCHVKADAQFVGNVLIVAPLLSQEHNLGAQSDLLWRGMTPDEGL